MNSKDKNLKTAIKAARLLLTLLITAAACLVNDTVNGAGSKTDSRISSLDRYEASAISFAGGSDQFSLDNVSPRIFSPDEGSVRFSFTNPNYAEVSIRIFDVTGAEIRKDLEREEECVMYWDGKDSGDKMVASGIYIYQVEADGKVINGTVVVVR